MPDDVLGRVADLVGRMHAGARAEARQGLSDLWEEVGGGGDPLHRCAVAHAAADAQDAPAASLEWNLRALVAGRELDDARVHAAAMGISARALLPSLHLNLAADYLRLGRRAETREHVQAGLDHLEFLPEDGYREMIREALGRIDRESRQ